MTTTIQSNIKLISLAESIRQWSDKLLNQAPLTTEQREDMLAIQTAARHFIDYAALNTAVINDGTDKEQAQQVRHQLRNYLNIIMGFSRLIVKELPDNLLIHMVTVRKIHGTGETLMEEVDTIQ